MEARLKKYSVAGVFVVFLLAAGWHFLYDLAPCGIIGAISPVNESPWEHAKLFFVPAMLWYAVQYWAVGKNYPNYLFAHAAALLIMPAFMLMLYYGYRPFLEETLAVDIANSFVTIALGVFVAYRLTVSRRRLYTAAHRAAAAVIVALLLALYIAFTWSPPACGLFWDPSALKYGI